MSRGLEAPPQDGTAARKRGAAVMRRNRDGAVVASPPQKRSRIVSPDTETLPMPAITTTTLAVVTPADTNAPPPTARRSILSNGHASVVIRSEEEEQQTTTQVLPASKRRLVFGRPSDIQIQPNVLKVYKLVRKQTGAIGGNGSFGAIYGELTCGSMQKMVNLMKTHTNLTFKSKFIDVGSGLGKPSLHVAQDPRVQFSYGIEMERVRWMLGMSNLKEVLNAANKQRQQGEDDTKIGHKCMFQHGNIMDAKTFHPFTHVYMFSIGFPPDLWVELAEIFNRSTSPYLICYHSPRHIIETYGFDVELVTQAPTSMHGSSEGHMGYIYRRVGGGKTPTDCDPLFQEAYDTVYNSSCREMLDYVNSQVHEQYRCGRRTRSSKIVMCAEPETPTSSQRISVPN